MGIRKISWKFGAPSWGGGLVWISFIGAPSIVMKGQKDNIVARWVEHDVV